MKKLLLSLAFCLASWAAQAQCTGVFPANTLCGNLSASPAPPSAFTSAGTIAGPGSSTANGLPLWANTLGNQLIDGSGQTVHGNYTWDGTNNFTGTFQIGGATLTLPVPIAQGGTGQATKQPAFDGLAPTPTRAGDVLYWNGTHWVTVAGNNSGTQFLQENGSGVPTWATAVTSVTCGSGLTGGTITGTGTCAVATPAVLVTTSSGNPTGTASTTAVMMGLGTTCHITPTITGRVAFHINGKINNNGGTNGDGSALQISYGTGTAPTNAAALTGTQIGAAVQSASNNTNISPSFALRGVVTGLTPSTAYWFDLDLAAVTGGTSTASLTNCDAVEF